MADLAASYAFGLAKNHPFVDGNKRASLAACTTFLLTNGYRLPVDEAENIATGRRSPPACSARPTSPNG